MKDIIIKIISFFMNSKKIILESVPDLGDNTGALYDYLIKHKYNEKYKIIWIVNEPKEHAKLKNVKFYRFDPSNKFQDKVSYIIGILHQITAKYIIVCNRKLRKYNSKQIYINLWHGIFLKKLADLDLIEKNCNYLLCPSEFYKDIYMENLGLKEKQLLYLGGPRNDELFEKKVDIHLIFPEINFNKTIIWMPTFRKQKNSNRVDSSKEYNLGIPIISNIAELETINKILEENNVLLILKLHPAQEVTQIKLNSLSHIKIVENKELEEKNIKLYNLIGQVDCLLTDYSSVYWDYMILNKPIGFTVDDIKEYEETKGFVFDEPLTYMPGKHINNLEELKEFIFETCNNKDTYAEERKRMNKLVNKFNDNNNCKRIVEFLEL